jgi:hypothetical protein
MILKYCRGFVYRPRKARQQVKITLCNSSAIILANDSVHCRIMGSNSIWVWSFFFCLWICVATNSRYLKGLLTCSENTAVAQNDFCGEIGRYKVRKIIKTYGIN